MSIPHSKKKIDVKIKRPYFPFYRYPYKNCYILVYTWRQPAKAVVLVVENKEAFENMGGFLLAHGLKEVANFEAETWRKAYNKAKRWADSHQEELRNNR